MHAPIKNGNSAANTTLFRTLLSDSSINFHTTQFSPPPPILPVNKYCGLFFCQIENWSSFPLIQFYDELLAPPINIKPVHNWLKFFLKENSEYPFLYSNEKNWNNIKLQAVGQATIQFWTLLAKGCGNHGNYAGTRCKSIFLYSGKLNWKDSGYFHAVSLKYFEVAYH